MNEVSDPRYMQQSLDSDIEEVEIPIKHESKPYLMIPIPDGATNGDMLCYMFPNMHYTLSDKSPRVVTTIGIAASFDINWWNAPYKRGDN